MLDEWTQNKVFFLIYFLWAWKVFWHTLNCFQIQSTPVSNLSLLFVTTQKKNALRVFSLISFTFFWGGKVTVRSVKSVYYWTKFYDFSNFISVYSIACFTNGFVLASFLIEESIYDIFTFNILNCLSYRMFDYYVMFFFGPQ